MGIRGEVYSTRSNSKSEKRTYFFNVKENRAGDLYLNVVESKKHGETDFERHQIVVFREDIVEFLYALGRAVEVLKADPPKKTERPSFAEESSVTERPKSPHTSENSSGEYHRGPAAE